MSLKITVKKLLRTAETNEAIRIALDKDLGDISLRTETAIKERTPVVTGRLKASMVAIKNADLDYEVATNVEYAPYVEYGTSRFSARAMMRKGAADIQALGTKLLENVNSLK